MSVAHLAGLAAIAASAAIGLRANMLKPQFLDWKSAPAIVSLGLAALALALACRGVQLGRGDAASLGELGVYLVLAITAWVMLINLDRQRHRALPAGPAEAAP